MALAKDLQIYKDTFELVDKLTAMKVGFPRMYRYDLGEKMTSVALELFEYIQLANMYADMLNPMLSTEEVKEKLHVSDATLNRMVARGDIPNGECKKRGHTRYWKKWDILHFIKSKRGK